MQARRRVVFLAFLRMLSTQNLLIENGRKQKHQDIAVNNLETLRYGNHIEVVLSVKITHKLY